MPLLSPPCRHHLHTAVTSAIAAAIVFVGSYEEKRGMAYQRERLSPATSRMLQYAPGGNSSSLRLLPSSSPSSSSSEDYPAVRTVVVTRCRALECVARDEVARAQHADVVPPLHYALMQACAEAPHGLPRMPDAQRASFERARAMPVALNVQLGGGARGGAEHAEG